MIADFKSRIDAQKTQIDRTLLITIILLLMSGLLMVYSSSNAISREYRDSGYHYLKMQALWCCIGLTVMTIATFFKYENYQRLSRLMMIIAGVLLLLIYVPGIGVKRGGGVRWLRLGRFSLQPSEFAKIAIIIYVARFLDRNSEYIKSFKNGILPCLVVLSVFFILIQKQPDFGSVVLIGTIVFVMLFVGGARIHHMILMTLTAGLVAVIEVLRYPYRMARLETFLDPWKDPGGDGYHIVQSFYAMGAGGILGRGLGAGMQKLHFLPVPHSDFIYAVIGEDLGFMGSLLIIMLFMVIVWRGIRISMFTEDRFGGLLAIGITSLLGIQAMINIGVVIGALPTKGLTLPFISFGGSSMLVSLAAVGILLNISKTISIGQKA